MCQTCTQSFLIAKSRNSCFLITILLILGILLTCELIFNKRFWTHCVVFYSICVMCSKPGVGKQNLVVFQICCFLHYIRCLFCMIFGTIFAMSANAFSRCLVFYNQFVPASSQNLQFLNNFPFHSFCGPLGERFGDQTWSMGGWLRKPMAPKKDRTKKQRGKNKGVQIQRGIGNRDFALPPILPYAPHTLLYPLFSRILPCASIPSYIPLYIITYPNIS
jgi:hypothetical protein